MKLSVNWESLTTRLTRPETNVLICSQCAGLRVSNRLGWLLDCWKRDVPPHSNDHDQRCSNRNEAEGLGGLDVNRIYNTWTYHWSSWCSKQRYSQGWIWMDLIHVQRLWFKPRLLCWHQHHTGKMVEPRHCKSKYHISNGTSLMSIAGRVQEIWYHKSTNPNQIHET